MQWSAGGEHTHEGLMATMQYGDAVREPPQVPSGTVALSFGLASNGVHAAAVEPALNAADPRIYSTATARTARTLAADEGGAGEEREQQAQHVRGFGKWAPSTETLPISTT